MLKVDMANMELEILYSIEINKKILGELIFDLKDILPDFSSSGNLYLFRNSTPEKTMFISSKKLTLRFSEGLMQEELQELLLILDRYLPNNPFNIKLRLKNLVTNTQKELEFNQLIKEPIQTKINGARASSIGFEVEQEDSRIFYGIQIRRDFLEAMVNVVVNYSKPFYIDQIPLEVSDKLEQVQGLLNKDLHNLIAEK